MNIFLSKTCFVALFTGKVYLVSEKPAVIPRSCSLNIVHQEGLVFLESWLIPVRWGGIHMRRIQDIMWQSREAGVTTRRCKGQLKGTPTAEVGQCEYQKEYWHIKFIKTKGV